MLVYVRTSERAQMVIQSVKLLRNSTSDTVRASVYLNQNFMKAEAKAQYEMRLRQAIDACQVASEIHRIKGAVCSCITDVLQIPAGLPGPV
jgi:hypothetical protein